MYPQVKTNNFHETSEPMMNPKQDNKEVRVRR